MTDRRGQLVRMLAGEKNHAHAAKDGSPKVLRNIEHHMEYLKKQIKDLEERLERLVENSEAFRAKDEILQSITGIGPQVSRVLIAHLPELGQASRGRSRPWSAWLRSTTTAATAGANATSAVDEAKCVRRCTRRRSRR